MSTATILPDDTARARRSDPVYSHAAADRSQVNLQQTKRNVLWLVRNLGPITGQDLNAAYREAAAELGWPLVAFESPRKRSGELLADGLLKDTLNAPDCAEYQITIAGLGALGVAS